MNGLLHVSSSPHARSKVTTDKIMFAVLLALAPAACVGVWNFGLRALLLIAISMAVCPLTEYLYEKGMKKPVTIADGSALVTGLLLAMNMPVQAPLWMPVIGGVFAILVVKQLFGGLGQNIMNPALAGRCFLLISFPGHMTNFAAPAAAHLVDTVSGATPLAAAKAGEQVNLLSMFLGNTAGTIGETSALALLIGGIFHQKFHDGYKRCHNNDVCWHTHAVRDDFPKQGNHQVGGGQDDHRRKAHADTVLCRSGNRKRRTHTQHHDEGRVFFYDTIIKPFQRRIFSHEFPPSPESRPDSLQ